jgi:hypothetical protein
MSIYEALTPTLLAAALAACSTTPPAPIAPAELQPPASERVVLEALASGFQLYECVTDSAAGYQWRFKGPEARLVDRGGRDLGRHYGGPTWEAPDGSKVVAEMRAQAKSPDANAIAHLLLKAKSTSGSGVYGGVRSIQRLATEGGRAPAVTCSRENFAQVARVPYRATYYFYGDK